jgi:FkbM family methyltransferase
MSLNKKHNNIVVVEKALWQKEDIIEFFESGSVASSVFHENKNSKKISIKATSLDSFVENTNLKRLNFIKMDIEGAEVEALEGAVKTISKFKPNFAIASYHIVNNKQTYIAVEDFFKRYDYPYKTEFFNNGEIMTYAGNSVK